jgi:putative flippase GtrA
VATGPHALTLSSGTLRQLFRYGIVGIGINFLLFLGYLTITGIGVGHKTGMTVVYGVGVLASFACNRNWSFAHRGHVPTALWRYVLTYAAGYVLNLLLLWWLVDGVGWPHAYVQGVLIFVIAGFIFLTQKFWVFAPA